MYYPATGSRRRLRPGMRGLGAATPSLSQIQQMITNSAQQYGVDPSLALSIAQQESSFNPNAVSPTNSNGTVDYGLMQINSRQSFVIGPDADNRTRPAVEHQCGHAAPGDLHTAVWRQSVFDRGRLQWRARRSVER